MAIIGRVYEQKQLQKIFQSAHAEFVAVYGRRRVGKTYLIREFFNQKKCIFFRFSGIHNASLKIQLDKFKQEIETIFYKEHQGIKLSAFTNWHDAFQALTDAIKISAKKQKIVIFLDEIPWMATPRSGLLEALDYYWNRYWVEDSNIKLIICGSAASWIIENVLHNKGGLHNRVTLRLPIESFNLSEVKAYLEYKKVKYNHEQILMVYMCLGGIPFYLNFIEKGYSAIQNIQNSCFSKKGTLYDEFELLFASLFHKYEIHEQIIKLIATHREGISRSELEQTLDYKGGGLTRRLKELQEAGFIMEFIPWQRERGIYYKVIDEYTLFYLTWIAPRAKSRISKNVDDKYWETLSNQPAWKAWSGYAFEAICFKHLQQIQKALNIPQGTEISTWRYTPDKNSQLPGAQIDLVFDRPDKTINLCEIKYCGSPFSLNKKYAQYMQEREKIYCAVTKTKKQVFHSMIVSGGLKQTMYSEDLITSFADLDDLFLS